MAAVFDWIDWLGGYPFEVATPGEIVEFFRCRGFELIRQKTVGRRLGCNEFVLGRTSSRSSS
jgi:2-polyprenyl-6-hydroxyphenyl methylase/3-demethylubiquinone-9 3-methyltransferase